VTRKGIAGDEDGGKKEEGEGEISTLILHAI
jgi:hypothetical protein